MNTEPKAVTGEGIAPRFELTQQDNGLWYVRDNGILIRTNITLEQWEVIKTELGRQEAAVKASEANVTSAPRVGDSRLKAFMLRHGFAIPTDSQLSHFPTEFRDFRSSERNERFQAGCALLAWLAHYKKA